MKEKILAQLKAKYSGVPTVLLGLIADKLATTVSDETAIETSIAVLDTMPISVQDYAKLLQTEGDRRATEAATTRETTLKEKYNFVDKTGNPKPGETPKPGDDNEQIKAINEMRIESDRLKAKETLANFRNKAVEKLKESGVSEKYFKPALEIAAFEKDDDVTAFVQKTTDAWKEFNQELTDQGLTKVPAPAFGNKGENGVSASVKDYIDQQAKSGDAKATPLGGKEL